LIQPAVDYPAMLYSEVSLQISWIRIRTHHLSISQISNI
jgi:hypothetical protein